MIEREPVIERGTRGAGEPVVERVGDVELVIERSVGGEPAEFKSGRSLLASTSSPVAPPPTCGEPQPGFVRKKRGRLLSGYSLALAPRPLVPRPSSGYCPGSGMPGKIRTGQGCPLAPSALKNQPRTGLSPERQLLARRRPAPVAVECQDASTAPGELHGRASADQRALAGT
jgi:hypothetical protein